MATGTLNVRGGSLAKKAAVDPANIDAAVVATLPEPARRYFLITIKRGAPLRTVTEIRTHGELRLGTTEEPRYQPSAPNRFWRQRMVWYGN